MNDLQKTINLLTVRNEEVRQLKAENKVLIELLREVKDLLKEVKEIK